MSAATAVKPPEKHSILLRPKTKPSRNNVETADAQYELEQQRIEAARRKREALDAERMRWHGSARGDPADKALVQCARADPPPSYIHPASCSHAHCILQPCTLHHTPCRETVQCDMRIHAAARDEAVQREELLSSQIKATVATRAGLEKELEERQSDARRELQRRRRLEELQSRRAACPQ